MEDQLIEMAREMGQALQMDSRFTRLQMAQADADADETLQALIGEFNLQRMALNQETNKSEKDDERIRELDAKVRALYGQIMSNEHMQAYNAARQAMDKLLHDIQTILLLSSQGEDPTAVELGGSCSGDCSGCSGCH